MTSQHCMGTYLHGILDNAVFIERVLAPFAERIATGAQPLDYEAFKQEQYDKLAAHLRQHVDLERIYQILGR